MTTHLTQIWWDLNKLKLVEQVIPEAEIYKREWVGLTDEEIKAPIQKAMQHFGFDPTQYSFGGMATIGFYGLVREIEAKLREKNT